MDKIYVVTSGCYSDYCIEKIFTSRLEAEKYCALENERNSFDEDSEWELGPYWQYECRVEEYPVDDVQLAMSEKPMRKRFIYVRCEGEEHIYSYGVKYMNESYVRVLEDTKERVKVAVIAEYDVTEEKLKKIIYDEIARNRAAVNFLI